MCCCHGVRAIPPSLIIATSGIGALGRVSDCRTPRLLCRSVFRFLRGSKLSSSSAVSDPSCNERTAVDGKVCTYGTLRQREDQIRSFIGGADHHLPGIQTLNDGKNVLCTYQPTPAYSTLIFGRTRSGSCLPRPARHDISDNHGIQRRQDPTRRCATVA
jgi:hypothetical protein